MQVTSRADSPRFASEMPEIAPIFWGEHMARDLGLGAGGPVGFRQSWSPATFRFRGRHARGAKYRGSRGGVVGWVIADSANNHRSSPPEGVLVKLSGEALGSGCHS